MWGRSKWQSLQGGRERATRREHRTRERIGEDLPPTRVDVEDVLDAAATKWNFHRYTPGVGVGGHCIPVVRTI